MHWILDGIILVIVIFAIISGAKKGFVRTIIELVCYLLAVIISVTLCTRAAEWTYDKYIDQRVVSSVAENLSESGFDSVSQALDNAGSAVEAVKKAVESSKLLSFMSGTLDISAESLEKAAEDSGTMTAEEFAGSLSKKIIRPVFIRFLEFIIFILLIILLFILIKPIAKTVNKIFSFSVLGAINKFLGGVTGLFTGIVISMVFVIISNYVFTMSSHEILGINEQTVQNTYIFSYLLNLI